MLVCNDVVVDLYLEVDSRAMEQDEELTLTLTSLTYTIAMIINKIKIIIIDSDGKYIARNYIEYFGIKPAIN